MFNSYVKILGAFVLSALLTACAGQHDLLSKDQPLVPPGQGTAVASINFIYAPEYKTAFPAIILRAKSISHPENGAYVISSNASLVWNSGSFSASEGTEITDRGGKMLLTKKLPPGTYEIASGTIALGSRMASIDFRRPLHFTVNTGELTYIGQYVVSLATGKNILGMTVPASVSTSIRDDSGRDSATLYRIRPEVQTLPFNNAVLGARLPD